MHHDLDLGVGQHARERGRVGRVVRERIDHLGAHAVRRVRVGHGDLGQAQQRLVAALGHELRVDRDPTLCGGPLCQRGGHAAATILREHVDPRGSARRGGRGWSRPTGRSGGRSGRDVIGRSAEGRPIRAVRVGSPRARVEVLVVGAVHGNEPAGKAVVARLRRRRPPRGTALWLIEDANPDGSAAGTRHNAPAST